jgi:outer membrane protein TolC
MAYQDARAESFIFEATELNLVSRLKSAYYELQLSYDVIEVLFRNKMLLERLAKLAENRYSAGQASQQDLIKSQLEIALLEARLIEVERNKQSMIAEINTLLNLDVSADLGRPEPATIPTLPAFDALKTSAMYSSPVLRSQRATVDKRQLGLEISRRDYYPDFEVMGGYFNQGSMKDMWEFRVQINIPLFFARKQRLGVEEAVAQLGESQKTYLAQERMIQYKIKDQYLAAANASRLMDLYQKLIIPQASLALESSLTSYSSGMIDFLSVLSNFSSILENEMKFYENRTQFLKAMAALSELTGARGTGPV